MRIFDDKWVCGYRVNAFPLHDKIFTHIEYFKPGSSLSRPPEWEFTVYIDLKDEDKLRQYPTSVISGLVTEYFRHKRGSNESRM